MNADKLAKQLKKELTRNPKKTAALGLVTLVALWFWAPLAWKWIGGDPKKKARRAAAELAQANAPPVVDPAIAPENTSPALPKIAWTTLLERMEKDEHMDSAILPPQARDPFAMTPSEEQLVAATPQPTDGSLTPSHIALAEPTPEAMGLTLEATLVSRHSLRATISGKTYRVGDTVKVSTAAAPEAPDATTAMPAKGVEYQLESIESQRVVLSRQGKDYPLVLKREALTEDEQLTFGSFSSPTTQP
jgi:hypothetical protein